MKIKIEDVFKIKLEKQVDYIAGDKPLAAKKFKKEIISLIKKILNNPLAYQKSIYFNDPNVRDLVYKGYVVSYKITSDQIQVFGFLKWEESY